LTPGDGADIATWRYPGRDATYDIVEAPTSEEGYWAVDHDGELVGYCCVGREARVPGIEEREGTLDLGYGLRPELVGRGLGTSFVSAIVEFAVARFRPERLRLLILDWNVRSRRVAGSLGFAQESSVTNDHGTFLVMVRTALGNPSGRPRT
jgi:RimJ/RimL family protein N-acetyltransferase